MSSNIGLLAIYVIGFIAIFYFLAVRPQQKQRKAHEELIRSIKPGDRVVTIGGIFGTVKRVEEGLVVLQVDKGVHIKVARRAIAEIATPEQKATAAKVLDRPVKDEVEEIEPESTEAATADAQEEGKEPSSEAEAPDKK